MLAEESSRRARSRPPSDDPAAVPVLFPRSLALSIRRNCAHERRRFSPLFSSSSSSMSEMVRSAMRDHWHEENKGYNGQRIQWSIVAVRAICRMKLIIGE